MSLPPSPPLSKLIMLIYFPGWSRSHWWCCSPGIAAWSFSCCSSSGEWTQHPLDWDPQVEPRSRQTLFPPLLIHVGSFHLGDLLVLLDWIEVIQLFYGELDPHSPIHYKMCVFNVFHSQHFIWIVCFQREYDTLYFLFFILPVSYHSVVHSRH